MINANHHHARAREQGRCYRCNGVAILYSQETAASLKGVWWCEACRACAFGGNSFTRLTENQKLTVPRLPAKHETCWVCCKLAVLETHHLAPVAQFGDEADAWPVARVCHECHRRWEDRMGTHPWRDRK